MTKITWTNERRKLSQLQPWPRNPRQIKKDQARRLAESFETFGQVETIAIGPDGEIYNGHQRLNVLMDKHGADYEVEVRVSSRALTEKEREKLTVFLHKGAAGEWDFDTLANEFEVEELIDWGFTEKELQLRGFDLTQENDDEQEEEAINVPDAVFPSDNHWGVPLLDVSMQADMLVAPFAGWGTMPRKGKMTGTWHFYVEDYRFVNVWNHPEQILQTACSALVEPNFSVYTDMPGALAVWLTYQKRWLARWWQAMGIRIIVDLNVSHKHQELNWLGVPHGWRSYATRAYSDRLHETEQEYKAAQEHAERDDILFVVYGGGNKARELSEQMAWVWYPDQQTQDAGGKNG